MPKDLGARYAKHEMTSDAQRSARQAIADGGTLVERLSHDRSVHKVCLDGMWRLVIYNRRTGLVWNYEGTRVL